MNHPANFHNPFAESLSRRILVVEDDRIHSSLMRRILEQCECEVGVAENGLIALQKLDAGEIFDLIIMDWDMPQLDGLETARLIRARQADRKIPYIPVIAFTGKQNPGDREKCLAAGMDGYLKKDIWMPRWRQSLIDILQGLISGNFDVHDFDEGHERKKGVRTKFDLDAFDQFSMDQAAALLKDELEIALEEFIQDAAMYIGGVRHGLTVEDFKEIERNSHPLKSNSKSFGLMAVSGLAESINTLTRDAAKTKEKLKMLDDLVPQLEEAFRRAVKRLGALIRDKAHP